jgi:Xaa-Pro aminopeptidase
MEYEIEFIHEFTRNRSKGFAYTPIIGSGNNANVLHYIENNQQCKSGDLILIDAGAEYANYSSDMTRTIPVSGKYNDRQKKPFTMPFYALRMKLLKCLSQEHFGNSTISK